MTYVLWCSTIMLMVINQLLCSWVFHHLLANFFYDKSTDENI